MLQPQTNPRDCLERKASISRCLYENGQFQNKFKGVYLSCGEWKRTFVIMFVFEERQPSYELHWNDNKHLHLDARNDNHFWL